MTREEIEQLADERYPTAKDIDASLTTMAEREGWIAGFEAGRQSVIDNIPDLKWEECVGGYIAETDISNYYIEVNENVKEKYTLIFPVVENPICFLRIKKAKQAANKHYKEKLKKALGL